MNITRAIEIKSLTSGEFLAVDPDDINEAERLSIEALKRIIDEHEDDELLPGETKD